MLVIAVVGGRDSEGVGEEVIGRWLHMVGGSSSGDSTTRETVMDGGSCGWAVHKFWL